MNLPPKALYCSSYSMKLFNNYVDWRMYNPADLLVGLDSQNDAPHRSVGHAFYELHNSWRVTAINGIKKILLVYYPLLYIAGTMIKGILTKCLKEISLGVDMIK